MNDRWLKKGKKWNRASKVRVARLFRSYVQRPSKPEAPIVREACFFHPYVLGEAHHVDYRRPFLVAWLCGWSGMSCHRRVDHGGLELPPEALRDYTALVRPHLRPGLRGQKNGMSRTARKARKLLPAPEPELPLARTGTDDVPF